MYYVESYQLVLFCFCKSIIVAIKDQGCALVSSECGEWGASDCTKGFTGSLLRSLRINRRRKLDDPICPICKKERYLKSNKCCSILLIMCSRVFFETISHMLVKVVSCRIKWFFPATDPR